MKTPLFLCACACLLACAPPAPRAVHDAGPSDVDDSEIVEVSATPAAPASIDRGDLDAIVKRGVLRVLVFGDGERMLPRDGASTTTDRMLAVALAQSLGIKVETVPVADYDALIPMLLEGKGDLIAARLTETHSRKQRIDFSRPTAVVSELLVGKKNDATAPRTLQALQGARVSVRKSSSYRETLDALAQSQAGSVVPVDAPEDMDTEELVQAVAAGKLPFTVADSDLFAHIAAFTPGVEALFSLQDGRQIGFGLRKENPKLKAAADAFLVQHALTSHARKLDVGDLPAMKARGSIRMLTRNDDVSYFLHQGTQRGFDYEMLLMFAHEQGLRLDVVVPEDDTQLVPWLLEGKGDVVAAQLPIQDDARVRFSPPYLARDQQPVGFAVRPASTALGDALNAFVKRVDRGLEHNVLKKRYFERNTPSGAPHTSTAATLSPYDEIIKSRARQFGLDWRLMAAQAYQESRFDPAAKSWVGAIGLFQVMPATGKEMGFERLEDPDQGAHAGIRYMSELIARFEKELPFKQRVRFALAAYNVGKGHVDDARRLARELGLDPNKWFHNVEQAMLLLAEQKHARRARHGYCRGAEPVKYVSEIQSRYDNYLTVVKELDVAR